MDVSRALYPTRLNLGSGKDFREDCLNLDVDDSWAPDAVCDLSRVDASAGVALATGRFGDIVLGPDSLDAIIANDVLEHVPDLKAMMTACLGLLRLGGVFEISVPYDLSYGAWQDPTHVRAFNERSWLYYTDWFWYMGWSEHRFTLDSFSFVPSVIGQALKERDVPRDEVLRTPRAIDSMSVVLRKIALSAEDRIVWEHWREKKRLAASRKQRSTEPATRTAAEVAPPSRASGERPSRAFEGDFSAHRDRYCVWIVSPPNYSHQHAYDEVALGLSEAFRELGGSAPIIRDASEAAGRSLIVLGPQLIPHGVSDKLPADSVLFNLEQVDSRSPWMSDFYIAMLRQRPVLDYSIRNQAALARIGVDHARRLPIGYAPGLSRVRRGAVRDIDVLFYGSLNPRRAAILESLRAHGVKVAHLFNVFGAERDAVIGRAKIVLNMHFYEATVFESVRVSFLLANKACVVSEGDTTDPDIAPFAKGLALSSYKGLVERCRDLLENEAERRALEQAGLAAMKRHRQCELLRCLFRGQGDVSLSASAAA